MKHVILFADNERGIRRFIKQELEREGYDIVLTEDGVDTLEMLNRFVVDAVILDEHMPRCSGLEAARQIRQQHPELPIILFTADVDYDGFKSPWIDAVVIKSADLSVLTAAIDKLASSGQNAVLESRALIPATMVATEMKCC